LHNTAKTGFTTSIYGIRSPGTAERYDSTYRNYIENSYVGKIKLKDLNSDHLQQWYNDLFDEKEAEGKKAENAVKNLHKVVSPCLRQLIKPDVF